jgi:hypothetical protein
MGFSPKIAVEKPIPFQAAGVNASKRVEMTLLAVSGSPLHYTNNSCSVRSGVLTLPEWFV